MKKLVSGIKPTGKLHLGNYLGAIKNWVALQNEYECYYFIADYHALTTEISAKELSQNTFDLVVDLLALGIDPSKVTFFKQSDVIGHTELGWVFNCLTPVSELQRMTQFKDKSGDQSANINAGLLTYPALQASDILLYKGEVVPVGEDQLQHLELTRIVARKFNNRYDDYFPKIEPIVSHAARVMSLNNPEKKMSKSLGDQSYIAIRETEDDVRKKIKKAISDKTGVENLLELYLYFGDKEKHQKMSEDAKLDKLMNSELKEELTKSILDFLKPIQEKIKNYEQNPDKVYKILADGAAKAQQTADKTLLEVKKIVGLKK
ncbi:tryptophan--tRNA ligase [Candidatus Parcubacteria bacterium]|jgi:tryptophanyl-tRNA synthetase|nr:tryptophan--tRNA ligase [Candidatus Parcubacteria bacterium]